MASVIHLLGIGAWTTQVPSAQYQSPGHIGAVTSAVANIGHSYPVPEASAFEMPGQQQTHAYTPMARYLAEAINEQPWSAIHLATGGLASPLHSSST